jgi:hypothetical protein
MRTTLTLDPDVASMLERHRKEHRLGMKEAVNQVLRMGFKALEKPAVRRRSFATEVVHHGKARIPNIDDIGQILEDLDREA